MIKIILTSMLAGSLLFSSQAGIAAENDVPYVEVGEVFQLLEENHVNKPTEPQLVTGALNQVGQEIQKLNKGKVQTDPEDDTLPELIGQLQEWEQAYLLDETDVNRWAINGMLSTLEDPHTVFFTKEELQRFEANVNNEYVGFGFRMRIQDAQLIIREVFPNSPAETAGLQPGDHLIAADGKDLKGKSFEDAYTLLQGKEGTEAVLTIFRPKENATKEFKVKRAVLSIPEVVSKPFQGDIGYIRLDTFGAEAAQEFQRHLYALSKGSKPVKGLVFDLRDNGGGYLGAAQDIASLFMEDGLLTYMQDRNGVEIARWVHNGEEIHIPVKILVNEGTASASELLSGALRDHGIATLVGTKTYGKGSAQQVIDLEEGDALKITLHQYLTPNRTVVNHVGLTPDLEVKDDIAQVIEALRSLGVKHFEVKEADGDVLINGVPFVVTHPLFKATPQGLMMRAEVFKSVMKQSEQANTDYVLIPSAVQSKIVQNSGEITLTFTDS
ncbi:S41 family peptidase [Brevibacillus migulae]|uniref:S41 family peptidase n=1 Tax=Brevibacillus migulae TaxID=1644114 RepID=UPI00106F01E0|nr:S41 family peptidase [Brevibacillus migulae]